MKSFLFIFFITLPFHLFSQQKLSGSIIDTEGKPLDAATVTLLQNGRIMSTQFADHGKFTLTNLNQSEYQLSATLMGYQSVLLKFRTPSDSLKLTMHADHQQLKEVVITYRKPTIERMADRVVFNVENNIIASGGSVFEALTKAPGVQANADGGITASNKAVTVYIDDKPVRLSGDDLNAYLQSLPASNISRIEVMSNPPSKYEAQGGAVINIVSKKIKAAGFNANLSAGYTQGHLGSYKGNALFNYSKGKFNVLGSYGYSDRNTRREAANYIIYENPGSYAYWDGKKVTLPKAQVHNYTIGVDYNITDNQVFGLLVTGSNGSISNENTSLTNIYNNHKPVIDSLLHTFNHSQGHTNQYSFNLNYKIKLNNTGQSLNFDLDYVPYTTINTQKVDNLSYLPDGSLASSPYHSTTPAKQKINIWSGKADYAYKLGKTWLVESGLKYTSIVTENQFSFFNTERSVPVLDPSKSDFFQYNENTGAAYTSISRDVGKWTFKGGLRAEDTRTKGYSVSADSLNKNNYLRLFPTAFITYKASEDHVFGFNYARRIDRPTYSQLNPAKNYSSPYSYLSGNPFLKPSISDNVELSYTFKQNYTLTGNFYQENDLASHVTVQDNINKTFYDTQQNIGSIRDIGLQFSAVNHPASWWEINTYAEGYFRRQDMRYLVGSYENSFHYYLKSDHAFTVDKNSGLKAELSAWYISPLQQGTYHFARTYDVSAGISKTMFDKKGTLRLSAGDIFFTNPLKIDINYLDQHTGYYLKGDSRNFNLSFSYKLGKRVAEARKRNTASEEEKQRTN